MNSARLGLFLIGLGFASPASVIASEIKLLPNVSIKVQNTDPEVTAGLSLRTSSKHSDSLDTLRVDLLTLVKKEGKEDSSAEISNDTEAFGLKLQLNYEHLWSNASGGSVKVESFEGRHNLAEVNSVLLSLSGTWRFSSFEYKPDAINEMDKVKHSWDATFSTSFFFASEKRVTADPASAPAVPLGPVLPPPVQFNTWYFAPQLRLSYGRAFEAADPVGVLQPPDERGFMFTKDVVVDKPSAKPKGALLLAFAFQPPLSVPLSFAVVGRLRNEGESGANNPFSDQMRVRGELWTYYYHFLDNGATARIGFSPFVQNLVLADDEDRKGEWTAGILIELLAAPVRLIVDP